MPRSMVWYLPCTIHADTMITVSVAGRKRASLHTIDPRVSHPGKLPTVRYTRRWQAARHYPTGWKRWRYTPSVSRVSVAGAAKLTAWLLHAKTCRFWLLLCGWLCGGWGHWPDYTLCTKVIHYPLVYLWITLGYYLWITATTWLPLVTTRK